MCVLARDARRGRTPPPCFTTETRHRRAPAGRRPQHNAEYFGEVYADDGRLVQEFGMFDNMYNQGESSRVLIIQARRRRRRRRRRRAPVSSSLS